MIKVDWFRAIGLAIAAWSFFFFALGKIDQIHFGLIIVSVQLTFLSLDVCDIKNYIDRH